MIHEVPTILQIKEKQPIKNQQLYWYKYYRKAFVRHISINFLKREAMLNLERVADVICGDYDDDEDYGSDDE